MTRKWSFLALLLLAFQNVVDAVPTWPASTDELEDILYLQSGYKGRYFWNPVKPCSSGASPGRVTGAEWIRTAFHDMATGNVYSGVGGLDGSIQFELGSNENIGPAFPQAMLNFAPFYSNRISLSDIIAAGAYTAIRSCGGPVIPVRGGRVDATVAGPGGVPLPQNALGTFKNQFLRFGYNATEMIQFVGCGHTFGGVHSEDFPQIVPPNTVANNIAHFDTTPATFDTDVLTSYLDGSTKDPLVISNTKQNSNFIVFNSDKNVTVKAMANAAVYQSTCIRMFQRMIEIVPAGVVLTDPVVPYEVKPYGLQLTLMDGGSLMGFTGEIRVRTTQRSDSSITSVQLAYKDRSGVAAANNINLEFRGQSQGFDDTFTFYGFNTVLSTASGISSFSVAITSSGSTTTFNNNGNGYTITDSIIYQAPQSCLDSSTDLTAVAAVRNDTATPTLTVVVKVPRGGTSIVPSLSTSSAVMATQSAVGPYHLYSATYSFSGNQSQTGVFGVSIAGASDSNKNSSSVPTSCVSLTQATPSKPPLFSTISFQGCYSDGGNPRSLSAIQIYGNDMTVEKCASFCSNYQFFGLEYGGECYCGNKFDPASTLTALSDCSFPCSGNSQQRCGAGNRLSTYRNLNHIATINPNVTGYNYLGCYSEGSNSRALIDSATSSDSMTVEGCATFCGTARYFGVEYGRECYCGTTLQEGSTLQPAADCSQVCSGNSTEYCGAGNRLNLYKKNIYGSPRIIPPTSTSTSTPTTASLPTTTATAIPTPSLSGYTYRGCIVDSITDRVLINEIAQSSSLTYASCASFCLGYQFFGLEYGRECYCGWLPSSFTMAPDTDCNFPCSGNSSQVCGAGSRITVFRDNKTYSQPGNASIPGYEYIGCYPDSVNERVFDGAVYYDTDGMSVEQCRDRCDESKLFGVEFGSECYCGDGWAVNSTVAADAECSFLCPGNRTEFCGAGNRMSVYERKEEGVGRLGDEEDDDDDDGRVN